MLPFREIVIAAAASFRKNPAVAPAPLASTHRSPAARGQQ
jgi:hypothetical protein